MMHRQNKNVSAARVELVQVSEVAGGLETATPLTFNRYSAYMQQIYLCCKIRYIVRSFVLKVLQNILPKVF